MAHLFEYTIGLLVLIFVVLAVFLGLAGCTTVSGGQAGRETKGLEVRVQPDGAVTITDTTARASTTQPTATGILRTVGLSGGSADEIGAVTVAGVKSSVPQIVLGLALIALGVALWKVFGQLVLGLASIGAGIAAFLVPTALGVVALVGVGGVALYFAWDTIRDLVRGNARVIASSNGQGDQIKLMLAAEQGKTSMAAVKAAK